MKQALDVRLGHAPLLLRSAREACPEPSAVHLRARTRVSRVPRAVLENTKSVDRTKLNRSRNLVNPSWDVVIRPGTTELISYSSTASTGLPAVASARQGSSILTNVRQCSPSGRGNPAGPISAPSTSVSGRQSPSKPARAHQDPSKPNNDSQHPPEPLSIHQYLLVPAEVHQCWPTSARVHQSPQELTGVHQTPS